MTNLPPPNPGTGAQHCTNCGTTIAVGAAICTSCGFSVGSAKNYCRQCGAATSAGQAVCTQCGVAVAGSAGSGLPGSKNRTTAGVLALLLGWLGVHKFYLGRNTPGIIMAAGSIATFCCGFFLLIPWILSFGIWAVGVAEGIIMLTKTDAEFEQIYVQQQKEWF